MNYYGKVQGGVVVFAEGSIPPEGLEVLVVPRAVDESLAGEETLAGRLLQLAQWAESQPCHLPADLAANHDHYLHGLPKRS